MDTISLLQQALITLEDDPDRYNMLKDFIDRSI